MRKAGSALGELQGRGAGGQNLLPATPATLIALQLCTQGCWDPSLWVTQPVPGSSKTLLVQGTATWWGLFFGGGNQKTTPAKGV